MRFKAPQKELLLVNAKRIACTIWISKLTLLTLVERPLNQLVIANDQWSNINSEILNG